MSPKFTGIALPLIKNPCPRNLFFYWALGMDSPSEIDVLRREVSRLLHEKINAHIEPTSLDKYTLGTDLATVEDMCTVISCLRSHVLEVDARANARIEENTRQLTSDYQLFNELTAQARNTISLLLTQKTDAEAREASVCTLEGTFLSKLLSTEAQLTARAEVAEALENVYKDQFTKLTGMYVTLLEAYKAIKKKLEHICNENAVLRQDNIRLTNELTMLHTDYNAAHERADNTLSIYAIMGERLSTILDQWSNYYTNRSHNELSIITQLDSTSNSIEEMRKTIDSITLGLQCTVTDQEKIIATLTTELDELQNKELKSEINTDRLCFLEAENNRLMSELASARYLSDRFGSSNTKAEVTNVSIQTIEQSDEYSKTTNCNDINSS